MERPKRNPKRLKSTSHFQDELLFSNRKKEETVSILEKQDVEGMKKLAYKLSVKVKLIITQ